MTKNKEFLPKISAIIAGAFFALFLQVGTTFAQDSLLGLTQTEAVLGVNQSISVVSFNVASLTVSSDSKSVKASVYGGNQITLYGVKVGNAIITVCNEDLGCSMISVKVQKNKDLKFKLNKSKVTVKAGETATVVSSNGKNITALANSGAVNVLAEKGKIIINGSYAGSATITVCSTNRGCLPIFVKVTPAPVKSTTDSNYNSFNGNDSRILRLSQISVNMLNKETFDITAQTDGKVSGAISDSDSVRTAINGNRITLYASYIGESVVKICDDRGNCGSVYVKVLDPKKGNFQITQKKVDLKTGESAWVGTRYGTEITVSSNSWSASAKVKGNLVLINASTYPGKAIIYVCSKNASCIPVTVNVENPIRPKISAGTFGSYTIVAGKSLTIPLRNSNQTTYYIINNSDSNVVSAILDGTNLIVKGLAYGVATISLCPTSPGFNCGTIAMTINENPEVNKAQVQVSEKYVVMNVGQTSFVTASTSKGLAAFSDSEVVQTGVSADKITLYGMYAGDAVVTVCAGNGTCTEIRIKVSS